MRLQFKKGKCNQRKEADNPGGERMSEISSGPMKSGAPGRRDSSTRKSLAPQRPKSNPTEEKRPEGRKHYRLD